MKITESEILSALSEPVRLRIAVLLTRGELCVCDLVDVLSLPQSTVSRHIARLRCASLIHDRREGKWVHYRLNENGHRFWNSLSKLIESLSDTNPFRTDLEKLELRQKEVSPCPPAPGPQDRKVHRG